MIIKHALYAQLFSNHTRLNVCNVEVELCAGVVPTDDWDAEVKNQLKAGKLSVTQGLRRGC